MNGKMIGATLPGNSTVEFKEFDIPKPGHGQVLIQTMASTICGSDIRCIYREHTGKARRDTSTAPLLGMSRAALSSRKGKGFAVFTRATA